MSQKEKFIKDLIARIERLFDDVTAPIIQLTKDNEKLLTPKDRRAK